MQYLPWILALSLVQLPSSAPQKKAYELPPALRSVTKNDIRKFRSGSSLCYTVRIRNPPRTPYTDTYCDDTANGPGLDGVETWSYDPAGRREKTIIHIFDRNHAHRDRPGTKALHIRRFSPAANDLERNFFHIILVYEGRDKAVERK